ncbi:MAG: HD domain-containing protein [Planctomycetota bacterium]
MNLERAISIATEAHAGQTQRNGEPYILHPMRVMLSLSQGPTAPSHAAGDVLEKLRIVAILHDVVEDTPWTLTALREEGFADDVLAAIDSVTKRDGEDYPAFVERSGADTLGRWVKLADLEDNMDIKRLPTWKAKDAARAETYVKAWRRLKAWGSA